jgi:uncharacterized protein (DUF302 family)
VLRAGQLADKGFRKTMTRPIPILLSALLLNSPALANGPSNSPMVVYESASDYDFTKENIELAITGHGLIVSGTLHVADMLNRTAEDLGLKGDVYLKAESLEFCSAYLSHRMIAVDPSNLTICPFTVAVYVLKSDPDKTFVAYRKPAIAGDGSEVERGVMDLLDDIARQASE